MRIFFLESKKLLSVLRDRELNEQEDKVQGQERNPQEDEENGINEKTD